jgi:predicted transcriptional regulator
MTTDPDDDRLLTEAELDIMHALWRAGRGTVRDVMAELPPERELAYTTVATMLRILEQKGFARSTSEGRRLVYAPAVEREPYERRGVRHLVDRLFGGDPRSLVRALVDGRPLSDAELADLRRIVDEKLGGDR